MFRILWHSGRRLKFVFPLSSGTVGVNYTQRQYTVSMSAYQVATFLPFQEGEQLTREALQTASGLDPAELSKCLATLVDSTMVIFDKEKETYSLNYGYTNRKAKFKLQTSSIKENSEKEVTTAYQSVDEDRRIYIQAAIVRSMKSRKSLNHNELIQMNLIQIDRSVFSVQRFSVRLDLSGTPHLSALENQIGVWCWAPPPQPTGCYGTQVAMEHSFPRTLDTKIMDGSPPNDAMSTRSRGCNSFRRSSGSLRRRARELEKEIDHLVMDLKRDIFIFGRNQEKSCFHGQEFLVL
eukprot:sb/3467545/